VFDDDIIVFGPFVPQNRPLKLLGILVSLPSNTLARHYVFGFIFIFIMTLPIDKLLRISNWL